MTAPDIDGTLPGQDIEEESSEDEVRRESDSQSSESLSPKNGNGPYLDGDGWREGESLRGWLYLIAGAGYTLLVVFVTMWFFMSGKKHSFFTEDPAQAKFFAGIIGLASLVIIALSWADYSREMIISAILTSVSSWSYICSSQMK